MAAAPPDAPPQTRMTSAKTMTDDEFEQTNGYSWDYCLVFAVLEDAQEATAFQREWSMRKIMQRIAASGLEYKLFKSSTVDQKDTKSMVFCKLRAPMERLKMEADRTDYTLLLDPTTLRQKIEDGFPAKPKHKSETDKHDYKIAPNCIQDIKGASTRSPYDNIYGKYEQDGPSWPKNDKRYKTEENGGIDGKLYFAWPSDKLNGKTESERGERLIFRSVDRLKLIMSILEGPTAMKGCNLNFDKLKKPNGPRSKPQHAALLNNYPLHDVDERKALESEWMQPFYMPNKQPLDRVKNYFGEKVALYFGWLGHYTTWLITPAVLGVAAQIEIGADATNDVPGLSFFGFFMCLWSTFFLEFWKRKQATFAMEWGMKGFEDQEDERPAFEGEDISSPITGESMKWFNPVAKLKKILYSVLIIGTMILMVIGIVLGIMVFKEGQKEAGTLLFESPPVYVFQLGGLLNAVQIQITNMFYQSWAEYLNDQENHRTDTQYEDALITKVFLFQFVNSFASFFFIAFLKEEFFGWDCLGSHTCSNIKFQGLDKENGGATNGCNMANQLPEIQNATKYGQPKYMCDPEAAKKTGCGEFLQYTPTAPCLDELNVQLLSIFVVRLVVGNFTEAVLPWILRKVKARKEQKDAENGALVSDARDSSGRMISPAEEQFALADYQKGAGKDGTFEDYAEMIVQFGFASLFVVAFPLAPLLAAINNHVEIRVDAFKLLHLQKRAEPKGAEDIGTWYNILEIMATCGVITNSLLVVFTASALFGTYETKTKWVAFVIMEHIILLIKFGFALAVDDEPASVAMQISRQDFLISKVIDRVADDDDELFVKTRGELKMEILEHDDSAGTDMGVFSEASTALAGSASTTTNRGEV